AMGSRAEVIVSDELTLIVWAKLEGAFDGERRRTLAGRDACGRIEGGESERHFRYSGTQNFSRKQSQPSPEHFTKFPCDIDRRLISARFSTLQLDHQPITRRRVRQLVEPSEHVVAHMREHQLLRCDLRQVLFQRLQVEMVPYHAIVVIRLADEE